MGADVSIPLAALFGFLLVLARVGGAFVFVPIPGMTSGPEPARALFALAVTVALYPVWPAVDPASVGPGRLAVWIAGEAAFGMAAGVAVDFLTEGFQVAAQLAGLQAGYSYASTVDPATQADSGVLQVLARLLAGLLFFTLGVHLEVLRVLAKSIETMPPGTWAAGSRAPGALIALGSGMLTTGLRVALPVIGLLVLIDLALALVGRVNAHLQLLAVSFPVKMLAALAMLAATAAALVPAYRGAAERTVGALHGLAGIR